MNPEVVKLFIPVLTDAIKILGPAVITGVVTWRIAKGQFDLKIRELEGNHEFTAREHVFEHYKDREKQLVGTFKELNQGLGNIYGYASIHKELHENDEGLNPLYDWLYLYMHLAPIMLELTLTDMEHDELSKTSEYAELKGSKSKLTPLKDDKRRNVDDLKSKVMAIMDIYLNLMRSNSLLLRTSREKVFAKYVEG